MNGLTLLFLCLTILLSVGRNLLSKSVSVFSFGTKAFFAAQTLLFWCGGAFLVPVGVGSCSAISMETVFLSFLYGICLISAQWCYTAALGKGNTGICATVYSLGFILPTLAGVIFWQEPFTMWQVVGVLCVIPALICSGMKGKDTNVKNGFSIPLFCAMLSSGGLGILQKVQQNSAFSEQKPIFVCLAFLLAGAISFVAMICVKGSSSDMHAKQTAFSALAGICFAGSNLLNTTLAGRLPSAILFPILNVGVILCSLLAGRWIFHDKFVKKDVAVLFFSILAIIVLNM